MTKIYLTASFHVVVHFGAEAVFVFFAATVEPVVWAKMEKCAYKTAIKMKANDFLK